MQSLANNSNLLVMAKTLTDLCLCCEIRWLELQNIMARKRVNKKKHIAQKQKKHNAVNIQEKMQKKQETEEKQR